MAAPLPFVETSHSHKANWKPLCEKSGSSCRFSFQFHFFFDADITILQGWATYASVHSWLTHSLCSGLFSDWMVFCLLQSQFKPGMSRFGFAILH
nr:MAG TPA: hypothetical protein [Caudoviricetes sp.]DAY77004.1 MAG TPA: hypothetical protein [Caudoviricetes sp.]